MKLSVGIKPPQVFKAKINGCFKEHQQGINLIKEKKPLWSSQGPRRVFSNICRQESHHKP